MTLLLKLFVFICTVFRRKDFRASRSVEGNSIDFAKGESIWWGYKHFIHAIEEPEPGKGIEEFLLDHAPEFSVPSGFVAEDTAVISAGGDIMPAEYMNPRAAAHLWDDVSDFFFKSDLACANLEAPINTGKPLIPPGKNIIKPPAMNNTEMAFNLCWRDGKGIQFYSTANNHAMDQGEEGLVKTLEFLDSKKVSHVGTARTQEEQDDIPVLTYGGIRIAFLGYTFSLNCQKTPDGKDYMANMLRLNRPDCGISLIQRHIRIAKDRNADLIVANIHWSLEYESFPIQNVMDMGHRILEAGVDIILGNHPHTLQPAERYEWYDAKTSQKKNGLILYALGNLANDLSPVANSSLAAFARPVYHYLRNEKNRTVEARLLGIGKLEKQISSGQCPFRMTNKQKSEIARLRRLAGRLMPYAFKGE